MPSLSRSSASMRSLSPIGVPQQQHLRGSFFSSKSFPSMPPSAFSVLTASIVSLFSLSKMVLNLLTSRGTFFPSSPLTVGFSLFFYFTFSSSFFSFFLISTIFSRGRGCLTTFLAGISGLAGHICFLARYFLAGESDAAAECGPAAAGFAAGFAGAAGAAGFW